MGRKIEPKQDMNFLAFVTELGFSPEHFPDYVRQLYEAGRRRAERPPEDNGTRHPSVIDDFRP